MSDAPTPPRTGPAVRTDGWAPWAVPAEPEPVDTRATRPAVLAAWVRVLFGAIAFALALRVLAFEAYRIPSTSMEDTLLIGDFVLVSKLHFGPRVLGRRLPGFDDPDRGDVVVFNYPPGLQLDVSQRVPYIKRIVGVPGDTVRIEGKTVEAGGELHAAPRVGRSLWRIEGGLPSAETLDGLGLTGRVQRAGPGAWVVSATSSEADVLPTYEGVERVVPYVRPAGDGSAAFPGARRFSLDEYGPVAVPARGQTVALTDETWATTRTVIERFEGHTAERTAEGFLIDGRPAETYTFEQDYYFVLGDSRDDSADSRTWGFVPFDHVIGKAVGVYFSWDDDAGRPRWGRIGRGVSD